MSECHIYDSIVIGGGVTGLTAMYGLQKAGKDCLLIEKNKLGGLVSTQNINNFQCELGPSVFVDKLNFCEFLKEIGLENDIVWPSVRNFGKYIYCGEKICKFPTNPFAFITSPLFPDFDKVLLFKVIEAFFSNKVLFPKTDDESVADFIGKILPRRALRRILDPILKGVYGGDIDFLSARSVFPLLWEASKNGKNLYQYLRGKKSGRGIFVLRNGVESLVEALKKYIPEQNITFKEVSNLGFDDNKIKVFCHGEELSAKNLYIATSGPATASYLNDIDADLAANLKQMAYTALWVVNCAIKVNNFNFKNAFGILFPKGMEYGLLGIMFNSELFPHKAPKDWHLCMMCFGGRLQQNLVESNSGEYWKEVALHELKNRLNVQEVKYLASVSHPYAIPQYELGHYKLVYRMRELEKKHQGLHFIGADNGGIAVPDRVFTAMNII